MKRQLKGYQGLFLNKETQEKLIKSQRKPLSDNIEDMHVTFHYGIITPYPDELIGKTFSMRVIGYASDEKNSGFQVELPIELQKYYENPNGPHITVSLGEVDGVKGKAVDTGVMDFQPLDEPFEITGDLGYFIYGKGKMLNNKLFKEENEMEKQEVATIDITKLAEELGLQPQQRTLPDGRVAEQVNWTQEYLLKAVEKLKHLSSEGKPVRIDGRAPAWLVSAITHTVHPCPVSVYVPAIEKDISVGSLKRGKANPEGEVKFKVTEKGDSVLVEYEMDLPEGITTYDENNLSKVVVPEIPHGKAVYLSGRGPNYLTVSIAESYAHTNSSVSLNQPGIGYTCSITHSRNKKLGDLTKDPLGKEEIKESLTQEQSHSTDTTGPSID